MAYTKQKGTLKYEYTFMKLKKRMVTECYLTMFSCLILCYLNQEILAVHWGFLLNFCESFRRLS